MSELDRRALIGLTAVAVAAAASSPAAAQAGPKSLAFKDMKKEGEVNVVYHLDFGDPARFSAMLGNINNHLSVYEFDPFKVKIVVVAHASGVKYFLKTLEGTPWAKDTLDPELAQRMAALAKYGVEVYLCQITFRRMKIDTALIRNEPYINLVPSGVAAVGELQAKGYGYLKIG